MCMHKCSTIRQALLLITTVESQIPSGKMWLQLMTLGVTEDKLVRDWKKKSLYCLGKAEFKRRQNLDQAIEYLEECLKVIKEVDVASLRDVRGLLSEAKKLRAAEAKKEKSTWSKAFKKIKDEPEESPEDSSAKGADVKKPVNPVVSPSAGEVAGTGGWGWLPLSMSSGSIIPFLGMGLLGIVGFGSYWFMQTKLKRLR